MYPSYLKHRSQRNDCKNGFSVECALIRYMYVLTLNGSKAGAMFGVWVTVQLSFIIHSLHGSCQVFTVCACSYSLLLM